MFQSSKFLFHLFFCVNFINPCFSQVYIRGQKHECFSKPGGGDLPFPCKNCGTMRNKGEHFCYIQPLGSKSAAGGKTRYIFFDIESTQTSKIVVNGIKVSPFGTCVVCIQHENFFFDTSTPRADYEYAYIFYTSSKNCYLRLIKN
jgi:hypothetical protein